MNNRADNLAWTTKLENEAHKYRHGTMRMGERKPGAKLTAESVLTIRQRLSAGEAGRALAREYGVDPKTIYSVKVGRNWRHVSEPLR